MRARKPILIAVTAVVIAAIVGAIAEQQGGAAGAQRAAPSLEGSWIVRITGGPGTPELPSWYGAQLTVIPGGGLVATIADRNIKTGHGAWRRVGRASFAVSIRLWQFSPAGDFLGTLRARATLTVDRRSRTFESRDYRFEFFDPDGRPTGFTGVGRAHGTRIAVDR